MAQATNVNERLRTFTAPPTILFIAILAMTVIVVGAFLLTNISTAPTVQPRSDAVLESGRAWQRQYEQMSGLEARRNAYDAAVLQSGRDWEQRYRDMGGQ